MKSLYKGDLGVNSTNFSPYIRIWRNFIQPII